MTGKLKLLEESNKKEWKKLRNFSENEVSEALTGNLLSEVGTLYSFLKKEESSFTYGSQDYLMSA